MARTLYVFGNEYLAQDSMAHRVSSHLISLSSNDWHIAHCRSPEELLEATDETIYILDVIKGINAPVIVQDITKLKTRSLVSLHDFDVGFFLNLLQTLRGNVQVKILGVPEQGDPKSIAETIQDMLDALDDNANEAPTTNIIRINIIVKGIVQGVGFRPFVHNLAHELNVCGWTRNTSEGVEIEAQASENVLQTFVKRIESDKPTNANILSITTTTCKGLGEENDFTIKPSVGTKTDTLILPDLATCQECLRDITTPGNRRYQYPFTNCTHCGPRFSIITALPYDRVSTTMKQFTMCPACREEYENPADRRFHAQPNACPACGPELALLDANGKRIARGNASIDETARAVKAGKIVAVKGIGGFHLIVDATDKDAVALLRERKHREEKPFAVMFPSIASVHEHCEVASMEEHLLNSQAAPIVILKRKAGSVLVHASKNNPYTGAFLPYSPLHHILLKAIDRPIVATSGNKTDERICIDNDEAGSRLAGIVDYFLVHNRPIARHVDDSVARVIAGEPVIIRPGRGCAPSSFTIAKTKTTTKTANSDQQTNNNHNQSMIALGAQLKNTVALRAGASGILSSHIGDLDHKETFDAFEQAVTDLERLYSSAPAIIIHDKHPDYMSTHYAQEHCAIERRGAQPHARTVAVQHHYAHALSCMLDNNLLVQARETSVLAVTWDGTGYGDDGTIWGGEFLVIDIDKNKQNTAAPYERVATFRSFMLPGGDAAIKHVDRIAYSVLLEIGKENSVPLSTVSDKEKEVLRTMLSRKVNSPITTSAGRLFDAVSALLGVCTEAHYEGQAAMMLECASIATTETYQTKIIEGKPLVIDWKPMMEDIIKDINAGVEVGKIGGKFHSTMAEAIVTIAKMTKMRTGIKDVCLTGGCFQNKLLTEITVAKLKANGFMSHVHKNISPNDAGIALGQLVAAELEFNRSVH